MAKKSLFSLCLNDFYKITKGVERIEKSDGYFLFRRFTKSEEEQYKEYLNGYFYQRTMATAGVKISFTTNSTLLCLKGKMVSANCRNFYSSDVYVDGKPFYSITNVKEEPVVPNLSEQVYPLSSFETFLDLASGDKKIEIFFPWSVDMQLKELLLSADSEIIPEEKKNEIVFYGDSITQGYDCLRIRTHNTFQVASYFNADLINKAVGGMVFCPKIIEKSHKQFLKIFVAYGTNDFSSCKKEEFENNCYEFFRKLLSFYPNIPIYVITPIYRICDKELLEKVDFSLDYARKYIGKTAERFSNVRIINGLSLIEHKENSFSDLRLHPNEEGFKYYSKRVLEVLSDN